MRYLVSLFVALVLLTVPSAAAAHSAHKLEWTGPLNGHPGDYIVGFSEGCYIGHFPHWNLHGSYGVRCNFIAYITRPDMPQAVRIGVRLENGGLVRMDVGHWSYELNVLLVYVWHP